MSSSKETQPTIFVIFGGTGDLNARKLTPALYQPVSGWLAAPAVCHHRHVAAPLNGRGVSHEAAGRHQPIFAQWQGRKDKWDEFAQHIVYQVADVKDAATYKEFGQRIDEYKKEWSGAAAT